VECADAGCDWGREVGVLRWILCGKVMSAQWAGMEYEQVGLWLNRISEISIAQHLSSANQRHNYSLL
jgi:hypothetical protein